jgi:hypothetical protein
VSAAQREDQVPHIGSERREPLRFVAAGVLYLLLSGALFLLWLSVDHVILLVFSLSTVVAGLVDLSVGWPRLHRGVKQVRPR